MQSACINAGKRNEMMRSMWEAAMDAMIEHLLFRPGQGFSAIIGKLEGYVSLLNVAMSSVESDPQLQQLSMYTAKDVLLCKHLCKQQTHRRYQATPTIDCQAADDLTLCSAVHHAPASQAVAKHCHVQMWPYCCRDTLLPHMEHMACFVPGMLALGARSGALRKPAKAAQYMELAEELAFSCFQLYALTPTGAHTVVSHARFHLTRLKFQS